jgi:hypothetical protein
MEATVLPIRPELQAAYDELDAKGDYFAYAVCRTYDGQAWEVNTTAPAGGRRIPEADLVRDKWLN